MTESEWNECNEPQKMLDWLRHSGCASERRLRLFALASVRRIWNLLDDDRFRDAISVAERHADGLASDLEFRLAVSAAHRARRKKDAVGRAAYDAARYFAGRGYDNAHSMVTYIPWIVARTAVPYLPPRQIVHFGPDGRWEENFPEAAEHIAWKTAEASERKAQCTLLRDVFGNPFCPAKIEPQFLAWDGRAIPNLAQAIYDERRFDDLPILADALEDAGCRDQDILDHCRGPGPHVRGCWVIDLLLGKE